MPRNKALFGYILILFQLERAKSIERVMIVIIIVERFIIAWSDKGEGVKTKKPQNTN